MAHPVVWPKKTFFYPIGNTPPVCFTQDLSPGKRADILLLGCGDPRSILYTIHADLSTQGRVMDFTCCDWEPAILARNIILLTMIFDGVKPSDAWPIFFHFFLDEHSYDILRSQCRKLVELTVDMKTWRESKYGHFIRFCTERSLVDIRRHWVEYEDFENLPAAAKKALKAEFASEMKSVRENYGPMNMSSLRSAKPLSLSMGVKSSQLFVLFWTTGTTSSNVLESSKKSPHLNPTFLYSLAGRTFNVHYGTDPMLAFHLAPILASKRNITNEDLGDGIISQFSSWCMSFKKRISESNAQGGVVIRFFVGESLAFCKALRAVSDTKNADTGIYAHPWGVSKIILDADDYCSVNQAPLTFTIIETSNLADHTGLLNLLIVNVPILRREPWSIMHTNTLLRNDSGSEASALSTATCSNVSTLSLLLGVTPSSHLWHFSTHCNQYEKLLFSASSSQSPENISWRFASNVVARSAITKPAHDYDLEPFCIAWKSNDLAQFLFSVYMQMFADEDQSKTMRNMTNIYIVHYIRESFVAFLAIIKENVCVNWSDTMNDLLNLIGSNRRFLMGSNNYQDLICHISLRGLHTLTVFTPAYLESARTIHDRFRGWTNVPPVVCIVLTIPRKHLKPLEEMEADEIMTPTVQCESLSATTFHNIHSSIQLCFGNTMTTYVDGEPQITINEDRRGWSGTSDLIASIYIPAWILMVDPTSTEFGLFIRGTPHYIMLASKIGMQLAIYSTLLTDTAHVQVTRHRPDNTLEVERFRRFNPGPEQSCENRQVVTAVFDSVEHKATALIARKAIEDPEAADALRKGAQVVTEAIGDSTFRLTFDNHSYRYNLPSAVHCNQTKTRIARKSSYIEIEVPVRSDFSASTDLSMNMFPMVRHNGQGVNLLNMPYVNLDALPAIPLPAPVKQLEWMSVHARLMFSDEEIRAKDNPDQTMRGTLVNLKESIACIVLKFAGLQLESPSEWSNVFGLNNPGKGGIHTLFFINALKFDLPHHTVIVDACVVPLVNKIMDKLQPGLQAITNARFMQVVTLDDEARAWRFLLPSLAERCRTWGHVSRCEYRKNGIPVSMDGSDVSPICSCGKGKNLGAFGDVPAWQVFRGEATRVAIGPLFSFAFPEHFNHLMEQSMGNLTMSPSSTGSCARCDGPGKPVVRLCSVCKKTQYCSRECQKAHWKMHKKTCATTV